MESQLADRGRADRSAIGWNGPECDGLIEGEGGRRERVALYAGPPSSPSLCGASLTSAVRSAVIEPALTVEPVMVSEPLSFGVRPTAVCPPTPTNCP